MQAELAGLSPRQWFGLLLGIVVLLCAGSLIYTAFAEMIRAVLRPTSIERASGKDALKLVPWVGGTGHDDPTVDDGGGSVSGCTVDAGGGSDGCGGDGGGGD